METINSINDKLEEKISKSLETGSLTLESLKKSVMDMFSNVAKSQTNTQSKSVSQNSFSDSVSEMLNNTSKAASPVVKSATDIAYESLGSVKNTAKNTINLANNTVSSAAAPVMGAASFVANSVTPASKGMGFWKMFKMFLLIFIIALLAINLYSFYYHGQDALTYYLGDLFGDFNENTTKENSKENDTTEKEEKKKIPHPNKDVEDGNAETAVDLAAEKVSNVEKMIPTELNNALNTQDKSLQNGGKNYKANNLSVNVNKKAGFCYLGKDRGVRTCVEVDSDDTCMSNQIYPTMDKCVNPNLKE